MLVNSKLSGLQPKLQLEEFKSTIYFNIY